MHELIIDKEKFLEEHRHRVLNYKKESMRKPYLNRLEKYAYDNGLKLCKQCYKVYEKTCKHV
jgi:hypothetical protein